ncbi:hypothetical protein PIB30_074652 [Stylosanthes scabra]|uniref:RNase H type-1 domain-containing protein n=1 Tax=Stylosanthes scabra TaxID=79078 RepID=A0ABU6RPL3_9FABA|nr:hypothetical protein [Stylosanthes scabra]
MRPQQISKTSKSPRIPVIWRPPPRDWLKINVDAAFNSDTKKGFAAVVIRDSFERVRGGSTSTLTTNSSLTAEATAMREALILPKNLQIQQIDPILQDIRELKATIDSSEFTWTPRDGNKLAHLIAEQKKNSTLPINWSYNPPTLIQRQIQLDSQPMRLHPNLLQ